MDVKHHVYLLVYWAVDVNDKNWSDYLLKSSVLFLPVVVVCETLSFYIAIKSNLFFNSFLLVCRHLTVTFLILSIIFTFSRLKNILCFSMNFCTSIFGHFKSQNNFGLFSRPQSYYYLPKRTQITFRTFPGRIFLGYLRTEKKFLHRRPDDFLPFKTE